MRIGIDARWIFRERSGIGVYTRELIRHLAQIDRQNQYVLFFNDPALMQTARNEMENYNSANFTFHLLPFGLFSIKNQLGMPSVIRKQKLDVFHSPNYMLPFLAFPRNHSAPTACVTTIHDLIPLIFPEATPRSRKTRFFFVYLRVMKEMALRSALIITDSQASRNDIIARLPTRPERVVVIGLGVDPRFKPAAKHQNASLMAERFNRRARIILSVGRRDPYKNLTGLIEAFALLRKQYREPVELRLVGPDDTRYPEPKARAQALGIADAVKWLGHVSDRELVGEYQNANLFVMPSLYEGFGLPALEAFACGTPVVCSHRGSLPEVCGEAALQIDPLNPAGISAAMLRVLTDARLADDLAERGLKQAAKYNWRETAQRTMLTYEQAMLKPEIRSQRSEIRV